MIYDVVEYFFYLGMDHALSGETLFMVNTEGTELAEMYNYGLVYGEILTLEEFYEGI